MRVHALSLAVQEEAGRYVGAVLRRDPGADPEWGSFVTDSHQAIDSWAREQLRTPGYLYVVAFDRLRPHWSEEGHALTEVTGP